MTSDVSSKSSKDSKEIIEEEEKERKIHKKSMPQKPKPMVLPNERKGSLFVERKGSLFEPHQRERSIISKKNVYNANEPKKLKESFKSQTVHQERSQKLHICVPQNQFAQVSIDFITENEKVSMGKMNKEDPFEGKVNYNYSLKPRKENKIDEMIKQNVNNVKTNNVEKDPLIFESVGFALANTISIRAKNNNLFEIKKGEPVCIRMMKDNDTLIECKHNERIGVFKKRDFYFWDNNVANKFNDTDIIMSPTGKDKNGPLKPNIFILSRR